MDNLIKSDLHRYFGKTDSKTFWRSWRIPGFRYSFLLRKVSTTKIFTPAGLVYRLLLKHYGLKYGFQIPPETSIGPGFCIFHYGTVVINPSTIIGKNCTILTSTTVGETNRGSRKGTPTLGDQVYLGVGSVVVGKITIGNNVLIAPNTYVNFDVPPDSIVLGNPGKIIPNENATESYVVNRV